HELKASEMKYRNLFESSRDAVFIADTQLAFVEVNHSAQTLLQPKTGTLIGYTLYDFIDDEVQKARIRSLVNASGNIDDLEIKIKSISKDDTETRSCLLSLYVHPDEEIPIVHGIIHDITNIKKAEYANLQTE